MSENEIQLGTLYTCAYKNLPNWLQYGNLPPKGPKPTHPTPEFPELIASPFSTSSRNHQISLLFSSMADENDKKTKRYTGTIKHIDKHGTGYIVPDMEIFVSPFSLSSNTIREGDRVKFAIKFSESNPQFEAIDVVPIKIQCFKCRNYGHSTKECRKEFPISRVRCFRCGLIGHYARNCSRKVYSPRLISNGGRGGRSLAVGSTSSSVVCVKEKVDVKKVEEAEDCFILEFDPTKNEGGGGGNERKEEEEDCEVMRSIVRVKNVDDVKKVEEVEDCFILEFDPDEPLKFDNLSICDSSDDVSILAEKGQVACRDYPHPRYLCATHPFQTTPHETHCKMCYCYVCGKPAPCKRWTVGTTNPFLGHCDANIILTLWSKLKELEVDASRYKD